MRQLSRWWRRVGLLAAVAVALTVAVPTNLPEPVNGSKFPLAGLARLFTAGPSWGADPVTPKQRGGGAVDGSHSVDADATRANGGVGKPRGKGTGELDPYQPAKAGDDRAPERTRAIGTYDAATSVRNPVKSTETSTFYDNADGTVTQIVSSGRVNYRAADGTWRPIDTRLVSRGGAKRAPGGRLESAGNDYVVSLAGPAAASGPLGAGDLAGHGSEVQTGNWTELASLTLPTGQTVGFGLAGATPVLPKVTGSTATYRGILPDTDVVLETLEIGIKETLVLHSPQAATSWVFPLRLQGLTARLEADGSIALLDAQGAAVMQIPHGYMTDSGRVDASGELPISEGVHYELIEVNGAQALRVSVDTAWLAAPERVWPVKIDPTFTGTTADVYVDTDSGTGSGSQNGTSIATGQYGAWINGNFVGQHVARGFVSFGNFYNDRQANSLVTSAKLNLFLNWTSDCNHPMPLYVHPVTSGWSEASLQTGGWGGPSVGSSIGEVTITDHYPACTNSGGNRSIGEWHGVWMNPQTFNDWLGYGGWGYGLSLRAAENNPYSWKRFTSSNYSNGYLKPTLELTWTPNTAPQITRQYPPNQYSAPTLTPELLANGYDTDYFPLPLKYKFFVYDMAQPDAIAQSADWSTNRAWTVPPNVLKWGGTYYWTVQTWDGMAASTSQQFHVLSTRVPQPSITSSLSQNPDGRGFEPSIGNFTTAATDALIETVGPALSIERSYNSRDPRAGAAFGAGWSSLLDAKVTEFANAGGVLERVVVGYPNGQELAFGRNPDGTYTPPLGRFATFAAVAGGYELTDKDGTRLKFTQSLGTGRYGITSITDAKGRRLVFAYTGSQVTQLIAASGRMLHLTWAVPPGSTTQRVATVATDQAIAGDPASVSTWQYTYTGDKLVKVCPPTSATQCTEYSYGSNSLYPAAVLDLRPHTYLRLGEASGGAAANTAIDSLEPATGTYSNVSLGQPGPLPGSAATAAGFNGTSSRVALTSSGLALDSSYQTVSMWFKTTTPERVLFSYQEQPITAGTTIQNYTPSLYIGTSGKLNGLFWGGAAVMQSAAPVTDGLWHHVVLTGSGGKQWLFVDGVQAGYTEGLITTINRHSAANIYVGTGFLGGWWIDQPLYGTGDNTGHAKTFNGSIADFAFHDQPVTGEQAAAWNRAGDFASTPLQSITLPSGRTDRQISYDGMTGTARQVTDANGAIWQVADPVRSGSDQTYASAVLGNAPLDYWRMQETGASTAINKVNGENLLYNNVTLGVAGPFAAKTAAAFDGTTSYATTTNPSLDTAESYTVSAWAYLTVKNGYNAVIAADGNRSHAFTLDRDNATDKWRLAVCQTDADNTPCVATNSTTTVPLNTWTHLAGVFDKTAGKIRIYVNGVREGEATVASSFTAPGSLEVGRHKWNGTYGNRWTGRIGEVATYQSALSDDAIAAVHKAYQASSGSPVKTATVTGPTGLTTDHVYDLVAGGRLVQAKDTRGQRTDYGYDMRGFLHTVTDPNGNMQISGHDVRGNVVSHSTCQDRSENKCATIYMSHHPDNVSAILTPDPRNDVVLTVRDGRSDDANDARYKTTYAYDTAGDLTSMTDPLGRQTVTDYTAAPTLTSSAPFNGTVTVDKAFDRNHSGLDTKFCSPAASAWLQAQYSTTQTISNVVISHAEAGGETAAYNTKDFDILTSMDGTTWTTQVQARGNTAAVSTHTLPAPVAAKYLKISVITPAQNGDTVTRIYEVESHNVTVPAGLPRKVTNPGGSTQTMEYQPNGDLAATVDTTGRRTEFTRDGLGRIVSSKEITSGYPAGLITTYTYDKLSRVATRTEPAVLDRIIGTIQHTAKVAIAYDDDGRERTTTYSDLTGGDPARTTERSYNQFGQVQWVDDALDQRTSYTYDTFGNVATRTGPDGVTTAHTYDGEGNLLTTKVLGYTGHPADPQPPVDLPVESRAYDPAGRLATVTDSMGWQTKYTYTDNNLVSTIVRHDPVTGASHTIESATYDKAGNLIQSLTNNGTTATTLTLDAAGQVTTQIVDPAGVNRRTDYTYGLHNVMTSYKLSDASGKSEAVDRLFDKAGRLIAETVYPTSVGPVPMAHWKFDEQSGTTAADTTGNSDATTTSVTWSSERGGSGVFSCPSGSRAKAPGPVIDTSRSYTVAAWAKFDVIGPGNRAVVSIDGDVVSGFYFGYSTSADRWQISTRGSDATTAPPHGGSAFSAGAPTRNVWTHLAGVFDAPTKQLRLYVNGVLEGTGTVASVWQASGQLTIGHAKWNGGLTDCWPGGIDDVRVYQQALSAAEVDAVYDGTVADQKVLRTSWKLDQRGLPVAETDSVGDVTYYDYDEAGRLAVTTHPAVSNEVGGGTPVVAPMVESVAYNSFGEVVQSSDANGALTTAERDLNGQVKEVWLPTYTAPGSSTAVTSVEKTFYDPMGRVTESRNALGHTTGYGYDQLGRAVTMTSPNTGVTTLTYTLDGQLLSVVDPSGARSEATYDYLGRPKTGTKVVRQTGQAHTTSFGYHSSGWTSSQTPPGRAATTYAYNNVGELVSAVDGKGNTAAYTYDFAGRKTSIVQQHSSCAPACADRSKQTIEFDFAGRPVRSRQLSTADAVLTESSMIYGEDSLPTSVTDPRGSTTTFTYDKVGRLIGMQEPVSATESITTSYGYDPAGNPTRFTDGRGHTFITTYNPWGLVESRIEPGNATFTTVYDAAGRPVEQRAPGGVTTTATYDTMGRLTQMTGTGAEIATADRTFGYDLAGRTTSLSGPGGTNNLTYDDRGLLLSVTGPSGDSSYAYTADGLLAEREDEAGTTNYLYDEIGRLTRIANPDAGLQLDYAYNTRSLVSEIIHGGNGNKRQLTYDNLDRLTVDELWTSTQSLVGRITYGWDANSNMTGKTTAGFTGSAVNTYTYDRANRLTSWNNGSATVDYGYDKAGNRTQVGGRSFAYNARNQLTESSDGTNYSYTARGTLAGTTLGTVTTPTQSDAFGQVIRQYSSATAYQEYSYDGLGRVLKAGFAYTGLGNDLAADPTASYVRGPASQVVGVDTSYAWTDLHSDVVGQFGATSTALTGSATYDPFGKVLGTTGMQGSLGYQSEWTDLSTGRVNMHARWYNPDTGQFDSRDQATISPVPNSAAANRYAYAGGNPMTRVDPTGHDMENCSSMLGCVVQGFVNSLNLWSAFKSAWSALSDIKATVKNMAGQLKADADKWRGNIRGMIPNWVCSLVSIPFIGSACDAAATVAGWACALSGVCDIINDCTVGFDKLKCGEHIGEALGEVFMGLLSGGAGAISRRLLGNLIDRFNLPDKNSNNNSNSGNSGSSGNNHDYDADINAEKDLMRQNKNNNSNNNKSNNNNDKSKNNKSNNSNNKNNNKSNNSGGSKGSNSSGPSNSRPPSTDTSPGTPNGPETKAPEAPKAPSCLTHSFNPSTHVLMADGTTKAIKDVKVGDKVVATDPETGESTAQEVTVLHVNLDRELTDVTFEPVTASQATRATGEGEGDRSTRGPTVTVQTTQNHPFWDVTTGSWLHASDLIPGESVVTSPTGDLQLVTEVRNFAGATEMRDLTVATIHTYYVLAGSTPALVHNNDISLCDRAGSIVEWVPEAGDLRATPPRRGMSPDAYRYQSGAAGARSDLATGTSLAPMLRMPGLDGQDVKAKFDGAFGNEVIDRKLSLPSFDDKKDHARRQAGTAAYHGLTAVYEFPTQEAADAARKLLDSWGVTTIITRQAN